MIEIPLKKEIAPQNVFSVVLFKQLTKQLSDFLLGLFQCCFALCGRLVKLPRLSP